MLHKSSQPTGALPVAHRVLAGCGGSGGPANRENCLAIRALAIWDSGRMIAFVGADRNVPNEAVNLLKIKIAHFGKSSKAVNLLKIQPLAHLKPSTD